MIFKTQINASWSSDRMNVCFHFPSSNEKVTSIRSLLNKMMAASSQNFSVGDLVKLNVSHDYGKSQVFLLLVRILFTSYTHWHYRMSGVSPCPRMHSVISSMEVYIHNTVQTPSYRVYIHLHRRLYQVLSSQSNSHYLTQPVSWLTPESSLNSTEWSYTLGQATSA